MFCNPSRVSVTVLLLAVAYGQAPARPRFEVASIKPSLSPAERRAQGLALPRSITDAARLQAYTNLRSLIRRAYKLETYQELTGPEWMDEAWFEVVAKLPQGATQEQVPEMLQAQLAERFKLVVRRGSKEGAAYILTLGKDGPKLKEAAPDAGPDSMWAPSAAGQTAIFGTRTANGRLFYSQRSGIFVMDANKITLPELASFLGKELGLPVLDRTGLKGLYEVSMPVPGEWLRNAMQPRNTSDTSAPQASDPAGVSIFKSVEGLGLRLDRGRAQMESLAVDGLEKVPAEN